MTNDEAYRRLMACGTSPAGALRVLTYAYWAQISGGWDKLFIPGMLNSGGSETAKWDAMELFREAGVDPMEISFPEPLKGRPPFGTNKSTRFPISGPTTAASMRAGLPGLQSGG